MLLLRVVGDRLFIRLHSVQGPDRVNSRSQMSSLR